MERWRPVTYCARLGLTVRPYPYVRVSCLPERAGTERALCEIRNLRAAPNRWQSARRRTAYLQTGPNTEPAPEGTPSMLQAVGPHARAQYCTAPYLVLRPGSMHYPSQQRRTSGTDKQKTNRPGGHKPLPGWRAADSAAAAVLATTTNSRRDLVERAHPFAIIFQQPHPPQPTCLDHGPHTVAPSGQPQVMPPSRVPRTQHQKQQPQQRHQQHQH